MKITSLISVLLVSTVMLLFSCKKHTTPVPVIPAGMSSKINDTTWTPQNILCLGIDTISSTEIELNISGEDTNSTKEIDIHIAYYKNKTGVYTIIPNSIYNNAQYIYNDTAYQAYNGEIILYQISNSNIQGTFSFDAALDTVTNGQFNIPVL